MAVSACGVVGTTGGGASASSARPAPLDPWREGFTHALVPPRLRASTPDHPRVEVRIDPVLSSRVLADPDFQRAVASWLDYWKGPAGPAVPDFLGRMAAYGTLVDSTLAAGDLPASLRFLPFIESGYNPQARSRARAVGMWQFMEATARELGLVVSPLLDQRRDPVASTEAAVSFLLELRQEFGSWFWALAAYNGGPNRARRILRSHTSGMEGTDSLFWALRRQFPRETRDFLPKFVAAAMVAGELQASGFEPTAVDPFRFDLVDVPDATTLDVVARAAAVPLDAVERLNPEYLRGMTPPGRASTLRVPEGRGAGFVTAYEAIPPEERVTFVLHRIEPGETLSHIAAWYGVRVAEIEAANPGVRPRFLRIGASLTVPVAPSARQAAAGSARTMEGGAS